MRKHIKKIRKMNSEILNNEILKWISLFENFHSISILIWKNNSRKRIKVLLDPKFIFHSLNFHYSNKLKNRFKNLNQLKNFIKNKRSIKNLILTSDFKNKKEAENAYKYFYSKFKSVEKINKILSCTKLLKKHYIPKGIFQEVIKPIKNKENSSLMKEKFKLINETDFIIKIKDLNSEENVFLFTNISPPHCNSYRRIFSNELYSNPYISQPKNEKVLILFIRSLRIEDDNYLKKFKIKKNKISSSFFNKKGT